ncbi:MAG: hypothetical protein AAF533_09455 [Acidobacteriota bacterium]
MTSTAPLRLDLPSGPLTLDESALVLDLDLCRDTLPDGCEVEVPSWEPTTDGLVGRIDEASAAVLWLPGSYPFDHVVRMSAGGVAPHCRDANVFFRARGTIYGEGDQTAWIAGTAGWDVHDDGVEKHPAGPTFREPSQPLPTDDTTEVACGYRDGRAFFWREGGPCLEHADPDPLDAATHDRIGLGTWDSRVRFTRVRIYRA